MWYIASLTCLLLTLGALWTIGAAFGDLCLPRRLRPQSREFLAPALGLAVLLAPATLLGWWGHGFRWWICLPITAGLTLAAVWQLSRREDRRLPQPWRAGRLMGFAAIASFPILGQVLLYNAFNPFNDTWSYLYQAQWLQRHGFAEPAVIAGHHPVAVSVLAWQRSGLRITPSFLLGWLQAAFGMDWSYQIYPAVLSLAVVCGALAVGGIVRAVRPGRRQEAWWVALAAGVTLNGFASGAVGGFYPQTLGLVFSTAAVAWRGLEIGAGLPGRGSFAAHLRAALPLAALLAAVFYSYPELCVFLAPAIAASYVFPWPGDRGQVRQRLLSLTALATSAGVLAIFEAGRAFRAVRMQAKVVAGHPVAWTSGGFFAHALGGKSGPYDGANWFFEPGWTALLWGAAPVVCFAVLLARAERRGRPARQPWHWPSLVPAATMAAVCAVALCYFRWFVANPWPHNVGPWVPGVGQTWSQFKLSLWMSPTLLAVAAVVFIRFAGRGLIAACCLAAWCALGIGWSGQLMLLRVNPIRLASGETEDPFGSYRAFCETLAAKPPSDLFYLDASASDGGSIKQRELLAYFLQDRALSGNWELDDNLPARLLPDAELHASAQNADWVVRYRPFDPATTEEAPPRLCRLSVARPPGTFWTLTQASGGYGREQTADGHWFQWTARELSLVWRRRAADDDAGAAGEAPPRRLRLGFVLHSFIPAQTVTVQIMGAGDKTMTLTVPAGADNRAFLSEPFVPTGNEVRVVFTGSGEPLRASAADPRELSFSVAAATLEAVAD